MGDVLYDDTLWRRWLLQVLARLGLHTNYRSFYYLWDHDYLVDVHCGRRSFYDAFGSFLLAAGLSPAQIDEVQAACKARRDDWQSGARPMPGVKSTLARLREAGIVLAVLADADCPGEVLQARLDGLGLEGLFSAVVSSIDARCTKPDPQSYRTALAAMRLAAHDVAFVGHDAEELAGAARAGMQTIAFNFQHHAEADVFIGHFSELLKLLLARPSRAVAG
jgi:HAD superfamily hydrolase (TIGR01509 family)